MSNRCLVCARPLDHGDGYHPRCSRDFFGVFPAPTLPVSLGQLQEYAARSVLERATVTGVQKKLSLSVETHTGHARFTIVGLWGRFILKPPVDEYPALPENEDTVMRLAAAVGIPTVPHALIRLASGEPAFITRRIDRDENGAKIAMEDFCQVAERLTADKYRGSLERVGRLLRQHSVYPGLDVVDLFHRVVFNYLCGNADMHLKNYALLETPSGMRLSAAYDLVSTALVIPDDPEESALTINGRKARLTRDDFDALARYYGIPDTARDNVYRRMATSTNILDTLIENGLLPEQMKHALHTMIKHRLATLT